MAAICGTVKYVRVFFVSHVTVVVGSGGGRGVVVYLFPCVYIYEKLYHLSVQKTVVLGEEPLVSIQNLNQKLIRIVR